MGILSAALTSSEFATADLQILKITGREKISELYWFDIDIVMAGDLPLPTQAAPGAKFSLTLTHDTRVRTIHGVLESVVDRLDSLNNHRLYTLRLVPQMSRLKLVETQQVYVDQTVPAVITDKLNLHDLAGTRLTKNLATYTAREFITQYKESDFAFVCRLAEHLGISFVFSHDADDGESLVFTDDVVATGLPKTLLGTMTFHTQGEHTGVFELSVKKRMLPSLFALQDYNYRTPLVDNQGSVDLDAVGNGGGILAAR